MNILRTSLSLAVGKSITGLCPFAMIVLDTLGSIPVGRRDVTWDELRRFLSSFLTEYYPETAVRLREDGVTVRGKPVGPFRRCYASFHIGLRVIEGEVLYALKGTLSPSHAAMLAWFLGSLVLAPFAFGCCCMTVPVGLCGIGFEIACYEVFRNESREFIDSALAAMEHYVSEEVDREGNPLTQVAHRATDKGAPDPRN